jgi:hypothetical protein
MLRRLLELNPDRRLSAADLLSALSQPQVSLSPRLSAAKKLMATLRSNYRAGATRARGRMTLKYRASQTAVNH